MFPFHSRTSFAFLMTVLPGIPFLPSAAQAAPPPAAYTPAATTVAILPVENISKGRDENMKAKQAERGTRAVSEAFAQRGFKLADPLTVSKAIQDSHLDLSSSASWTSENLAALGLHSAADLVVLLVITDTHQGFRHGFLIMGAQREGEAKTKLWLVNSQTYSAVIGGQAAAGKAQEAPLPAGQRVGMGKEAELIPSKPWTMLSIKVYPTSSNRIQSKATVRQNQRLPQVARRSQCRLLLSSAQPLSKLWLLQHMHPLLCQCPPPHSPNSRF